MNISIHRRPRTALVCAVGLVLGACGYEPTSAPREYSLNEAVVEELEDARFGEGEKGQLLGALNMLFGTPAAPKYLVTNEWLDDGFNPNWPQYPAGDNGSGSITEEQWDGIVAGNLKRFDAALKLIEKRNFDQVERALRGVARGESVLEMWRERYADLAAEIEAGEADEERLEEFVTYMVEDITNYYPTMAESAEFYRRQCLHCHGNEGGADGPTAPFLDPLPRDYRRGIFKYTALKDKARPRRADLLNVLTEGVYSTAMPNFRRFSDAELHGLIDYVQLLSIRGETELLIGATMASDEVFTTDMVMENYGIAWERWQGQEEKLIVFDGPIPPSTDAMIARGKELFDDPNRGNCFSCHGESGRGDGIAAWRAKRDAEGNEILDENGERPKSVWTGLVIQEPAYEDDWGHPIVPRDLTRGVFRFGNRPIDIYRRIYAGINGTPMPAIGESKDADGNPLLSDDDMWAIVHYVRSLSVDVDNPGKGLLPVRDLHAAHDGHDDGHGHDAHGDDESTQ